MYFCKWNVDTRMRKRFFQFAIVLLLLCTLYACSSDDDRDPFEPARNYQHTVLVYISGENRLSSFINEEINEMKTGSKAISDDDALIVYVDDANSQNKPYLARITDGELTDQHYFLEDSLSSDPNVMLHVLNYVSHRYPAEDYGLVLWGHGSGWLKEDSLVYDNGSRRGYGVDNGTNSYSDVGTWINIPTLANILRDWGHPLRFILGDCCFFQCIETAYELKDVADYVIGSPAEIPGVGAPYNTIVPAMFSPSTTFYEEIVNKYYEQTLSVKSNDGWSNYTARVTLSVIKSSELESLAQATTNILVTLDPIQGEQLSNELLYYGLYYYMPEGRLVDTFLDMNDYFLHKAHTSAYEKWLEAFNRAVVYRVYDKWETYTLSYSVFSRLSDERYGGVSMYIPQQRTNTQFYNVCADYIKCFKWYKAAGLDILGW